MQKDTDTGRPIGPSSEDKSADISLSQDSIPNTESLVVWNTTLDDIYDVRVVRIEPGAGEFSIREIGEQKPFFTRLTSFSYSAIFGPDVDDEMEWKLWALEAVEARKTKKGANSYHQSTVGDADEFNSDQEDGYAK